MKICVFCQNPDCSALVAGGKKYWQCSECGGIFLDPDERPSAKAEKDRYETHNNTMDDPVFRAYLSGFIDPVLEKTGPVRTVFDYGSGPEPVLAGILAERGYTVRAYDPFFAPGTACFDEGADLVVCHEVAEHFFEPRRDFARMTACVKPGGFLAIGTMLLPCGSAFREGDLAASREFFLKWWYRKDNTHVSFYTARALLRCASDFGLESLGDAGKNCVLFRKSPTSR